MSQVITSAGKYVTDGLVPKVITIAAYAPSPTLAKNWPWLGEYTIAHEHGEVRVVGFWATNGEHLGDPAMNVIEPVPKVTLRKEPTVGLFNGLSDSALDAAVGKLIESLEGRHRPGGLTTLAQIKQALALAINEYQKLVPAVQPLRDAREESPLYKELTEPVLGGHAINEAAWAALRQLPVAASKSAGICLKVAVLAAIKKHNKLVLDAAAKD